MKYSVIKPSEIPQSFYNTVIGLDIETEDLPIDSKICMISIYNPAEDQGYVIPVHVMWGGVMYDLSLDEIEVFKAFYKTIRICGHNLQFDMARIQYHYGVICKDVYLDTYLLARMCQLEDQGLKDLAVRCEPSLGQLSHFSDIADTKKPPFVYYIEDNDTVKYSALDAYLPFVIIKKMAHIIKSYKDVLRLEMDYLMTAVDENATGLRFDLDLFNSKTDEFMAQVEVKQAELDTIAGFHLRANSTADKRKAIYDKYDLYTPLTSDKTGAPSMSKDSLAKMREWEVAGKNRAECIDLIDRVIEIAELTAQYNGCKKAPLFVKDGNLHFNVEQVGFDGTARVYTKDFSVNQLSKTMREAVLPAPGKKFLYFDYKAAELYILWFWSKCKEGIDWYTQGLDPHAEVMKRLLRKEEVTKADRAVSKVLSFATIYGGNEFTIAKDLNCDPETAMQFQSDYAALFPEINEFKAKITSYAHRNGYTKTIFGRYRKLPDINSSDDYTRAKSERQAVNTAIQASCADFMKEATNRIRAQRSDVRVKFQVFDSILVEVPEDFTEEQAHEIINIATDFSDKFPGFKFRCDWAFGKNWKECQDQC